MNKLKIFLFIIFPLLISLSSCQIISRNAEIKTPTEGIIYTVTPEVTKQIPVSVGTPTQINVENPTNKSWWFDSVFYEIFVRSFYDSNGDGIGDFNGITQKMDYLNDGDPATTGDLGVSAIWLMPVMPSPSTHGYDVTDYYEVNAQYGTMDDFKKMLELAHSRGI
jgi:1,4-alpha-glucan branching enzyme